MPRKFSIDLNRLRFHLRNAEESYMRLRSSQRRLEEARSAVRNVEAKLRSAMETGAVRTEYTSGVFGLPLRAPQHTVKTLDRNPILERQLEQELSEVDDVLKLSQRTCDEAGPIAGAALRLATDLIEFAKGRCKLPAAIANWQVEP